MSKKILISVIALVALFGATLPAVAQEAEEEEKEPVVIPDVVQVTDPPGDANFWGGDYQTGGPQADGSDVLRAWFDNTPETISAYIQLASAPSGQVRNWYQVIVNPNNALDASDGCVIFDGRFGGNTNPGSSDSARVTDECGEEDVQTEAQLGLHEGPEGTAIVEVTVPRTASPHFEKGSVLFTPFVDSMVSAGFGFVADGTKPGADYTVVGELIAPKKEEPEEGEEGEEPEEEPEEEEEPEQSEPSKKKGKKGKGCAPWVPGELGAEAETTVVTEKATEEKPIEVPIEAPPAVWPATADVYHNIQVDTAGGEKGLFVRYEFRAYEDNDLYLYDAAGEEVAQAAGFNPTPYGPLDDTSGGGHSEMGAEQIDGLASADCVGYTAELHSFISQGGEYTMKLWLGDPAEAEEE